MMKINIRTKVKGNYREVMARFDRDLFEALTPPGASVELARFDGSKKGDVVHLKMKLLGFIKDEWISEITKEGHTDRRAWFTDEGTRLPFFLTYWQHNHIVENHGENCVIFDQISFAGPWHVFDLFLYPVLYAQFAWRKPVYRRIFGKPV